MDDIHLSREILRAVHDRRLPQSFLEEIRTEHLLSLCPHCRSEVEAYETELRGGVPLFTRVIRTVSDTLQRLVAPASREAAQAEVDLRALLSRAPEDRARLVERSRSRFRSPTLVTLLLEESRKRLPGAPADAYHLSELAVRVANRNPRMQGYFDLYVLATAQMANACRVANDRRRADELFAVARRALVEHGVTAPAVVARVDDLLGSLRKDQRRLPGAEKLLRRAATQFELIHATDDAARVLIKLGSVYHHQKDSKRAIDTTRSALALLSPEAEPRLRLSGTYNLAFYLTTEERFEEAAEVLEWNEVLFRQFPEPWTRLRLLWLQGDIELGLGHLEAAEQAYVETREGFMGQGIGYDAAMVSLDLAVLYLRQGRTSEVRQIAEETIPLFQSQDVHPETLAALALFLEAARQDRLTVEMASEIVARVRHRQQEPDQRLP